MNTLTNIMTSDDTELYECYMTEDGNFYFTLAQLTNFFGPCDVIEMPARYGWNWKDHPVVIVYLESLHNDNSLELDSSPLWVNDEFIVVYALPSDYEINTPEGFGF